MIILSYLRPGLGMEDNLIQLNWIIDTGIVVIFFLYGLKLHPQKIKAGLSNWRMHLNIQAITFVIFPLLIGGFYPFFYQTPFELLWIAVFFLAALPSTVSSSVVMVSLAQGNVVGAIFNASLSGLLGVIITPAWMGVFLGSGNADFEFLNVLLDLFLQILAPVILGVLLQSFFGAWVEKHKKNLAWFDKSIILLIVYKSFSNSFLSGIFAAIGMQYIILLLLSVVVLFFFILWFSGKLADWQGFNREDRITVQFCGTKKSLVHGSVMATVIFAGMSGSGIMLLPIMMYHAFQLFYISLLAQKYRKEIQVS